MDVLRTWVAGCIALSLCHACAQPVSADSSSRPAEGICKQQLAKAAQQMAENQPAKVCNTLSQQPPLHCNSLQTAESNYLRARALLAQGEDAAASAALSARAPQLPKTVAIDWRKRRARALARAGDCKAAIPALLAVEQEQPSKKDPRLPAARGRCHLRQQDANAAVQAFELARSWDDRTGLLDRAAVGFEQATAFRQTKQLDLAKKLLRDLSTTYPQHPVMAQVAALRAELKDDAPLTDEEQLRRAQHLYQAHDFATSAEAYETLPLPKTRADKAKHLHAFGKALFRSRNRYPEAAKVLKRAAKLGGPHTREDGFLAARALARADRDRKAVVAFDRFVRKHRRGPWVANAAYLAAWLSVRHHFPGARKRMQRFLNGRLGRSSPKRAEGTFMLAMDDFTRRRYRSAQRLFLSYAETGDKAMVRGRGLYWAARSAQKRGHRKIATTLFTSARAVEPLHYYAQLARLRLSELGNAPKELLPLFPQPTNQTSPPTATLPTTASFYARLGLVEDALASLSGTSFKRLPKSRTARTRLPTAQAYFNLGAPQQAAKLLHPYLAQLRSAPTTPTAARALQLLYARPHSEAVGAHAAKTSIEPDLVYAVMRKESNFDPRAHSYADAIGLLQLLPETAARVAKQAGQPFERNDLFTPQRNIELGIRYLAQLQKEFPSHAALVVAAYNAGEHQVRRWLKKHRGRKKSKVDLDLFVENIPIDQTRNYVRRVLTNLAWYGYMRGAGPGVGYLLNL